jgi:hypothetical protein
MNDNQVDSNKEIKSIRINGLPEKIGSNFFARKNWINNQQSIIDTSSDEDDLIGLGNCVNKQPLKLEQDTDSESSNDTHLFPTYYTRGNVRTNYTTRKISPNRAINMEEIANENIETARRYGNSILEHADTLKIPIEHAEIISNFLFNNPRIFTQVKKEDEVRTLLNNDFFDYYKRSHDPINISEIKPAIDVFDNESNNNSLEFVSDDDSTEIISLEKKENDNVSKESDSETTADQHLTQSILPSIWSSSEDDLP